MQTAVAALALVSIRQVQTRPWLKVCRVPGSRRLRKSEDGCRPSRGDDSGPSANSRESSESRRRRTSGATIAGLTKRRKR
eukprot:6813447-Prymnesium_polylepis.1